MNRYDNFTDTFIEDERHCALCNKVVSADESICFEHHEYNFVAYVMGKPILCSECWLKRGDT